MKDCHFEKKLVILMKKKHKQKRKNIEKPFSFMIRKKIKFNNLF